MAAGQTYTSIASQTLSSAAASVTFSSISGAYTDLILIANVYGSANDVGFSVTFNSDTGANYSNTSILSRGNAVETNRASGVNKIVLYGYNYGSGSTNNIFSPVVFSLMNYSNATTYKTILGRSFCQRNDGSGETYAKVGLWRNTAAITSMNLFLDSGNIEINSTFSLYGILAA